VWAQAAREEDADLKIDVKVENIQEEKTVGTITLSPGDPFVHVQDFPIYTSEPEIKRAVNRDWFHWVEAPRTFDPNALPEWNPL